MPKTRQKRTNRGKTTADMLQKISAHADRIIGRGELRRFGCETIEPGVFPEFYEARPVEGISGCDRLLVYEGNLGHRFTTIFTATYICSSETAEIMRPHTRIGIIGGGSLGAHTLSAAITTALAQASASRAPVATGGIAMPPEPERYPIDTKHVDCVVPEAWHDEEFHAECAEKLAWMHRLSPHDQQRVDEAAARRERRAAKRAAADARSRKQP